MVRWQTCGKRGRRGDSKFSNRPVTVESNRIGTSDSNSNRISKLHRSLFYVSSYTRCVIKHLSMSVCTVGWTIAIHCWLELSSQNATARLVSGACCYSHVTPVLARLHWLPVHRQIVFKTALLVQKSV